MYVVNGNSLLMMTLVSFTFSNEPLEIFVNSVSGFALVADWLRVIARGGVREATEMV